MAVKTSRKNMMKEVGKAFAFSFSDLHQMILNFHAEMRRGLKGEPGSLKMLPAYIDCPTGKEKGRFIALDLGGTNFRVLQVCLKGKGTAIVEQVGKYVIPHAAAHGKGIELFDFIAQAIQHFLDEHKIDQKKKIPLGFTFSFPVNQTRINKGKLISWTKGFSATDVVDKDVVQLLASSLSRNKIKNIDVTALANDTVGTLLAHSYAVHDCDVGVIFGTGTNGCYRESTAALVKLPARDKMSADMIVNTEWGNFNILPVNAYDRKLDKGSSNPGKQQMEKMISGMYLGELTRLVIKDLIRQKVFLNKYGAKFRKGGLTTRDISLFEGDRTPGLAKVDAYLKAKGIQSSVEERRHIRQVCRFVSRRAARISAAAISSVVTRMDPGLNQHHTVAIDGTLYAKYPQFKRTIIKTLGELHGEKSKMIKLAAAKDGSGMGVAIASAVADALR